MCQDCRAWVCAIPFNGAARNLISAWIERGHSLVDCYEQMFAVVFRRNQQVEPWHRRLRDEIDAEVERVYYEVTAELKAPGRAPDALGS